MTQIVTAEEKKLRSSDKSCNNVSDREFVGGLIVTAKAAGKAHIVVPRNWINLKVEAVLDNDRDGVKITGIVKKSGNSARMTGLPYEWTGERVFVKKVKK